jgi:hypothetical protein
MPQCIVSKWVNGTGANFFSIVAPRLREVVTSALGQKQTSECCAVMSALPPKADIVRHSGNVRFVPFSFLKLRNPRNTTKEFMRKAVLLRSYAKRTRKADTSAAAAIAALPRGTLG